MISWLRKKIGWYDNPSYENKEKFRFSKKGGKLLFKGRSKGFTYYILDFGSHPCAYVKVNKKHPLYFDDYQEVPEEIDVVHGGLTYSDSYLYYKGKVHKGWFFGWDYAHVGDFYAFPQDTMFKYSRLEEWAKAHKSKEWSTKEIIRDCENFCAELYKVKKKEQG